MRNHETRTFSNQKFFSSPSFTKELEQDTGHPCIVPSFICSIKAKKLNNEDQKIGLFSPPKSTKKETKFQNGALIKADTCYNKSVNFKISKTMVESIPEFKEAHYKRTKSIPLPHRKRSVCEMIDRSYEGHSAMIARSFFIKSTLNSTQNEIDLEAKKVIVEERKVESMVKISKSQLSSIFNNEESIETDMPWILRSKQKSLVNNNIKERSEVYRKTFQTKQKYVKNIKVTTSKTNKEVSEIENKSIEQHNIQQMIKVESQTHRITEENINFIINPIYLNIEENNAIEVGAEKASKCISVLHFNSENQTLTHIFNKSSFKQVEIASLTKIMTCYLIIMISEYFKLDLKKEKLLISEKACRVPGTSAKLLYSDTSTVYDMLHGLMLPSGNDAAVALSEWGGKTIRKYFILYQRYLENKEKLTKFTTRLDYYQEKKKSYQKLFILHMNKTAHNLKLKNTRFNNPHGLMSDKAYSCSSDIAKLTFIAMKNETFAAIVACKEYEYNVFNRTYNQERKGKWINTNKLLQTDGVLGVKTGVTPSAGPCLSTMFNAGNFGKIIVIVLGSKSMEDRFKESLSLLKETMSLLGMSGVHLLDKEEKYLRTASTIDQSEEANLINEFKDYSSDEVDDDEED